MPNESLESIVRSYFLAFQRRDFARCVELLYPGDVDKFRAQLLWCARAMAPFGEAGHFLELFGPETEYEDLEVLSPPAFLTRLLAGAFGSHPPETWEKVEASLVIVRVERKAPDAAVAVYSFDATPWEKEPCRIEREMELQQVGDRWFVLLEQNLRALSDKAMRDSGEFERRRQHDVPHAARPDWPLEPFALHGFRNRDTGVVAIEPRFRDAGPFACGLAPVRFFSKWGFINAAGATVIAPRYDRAREFCGDLAAVATRSNGGELRWNFIDTTGRLLLTETFDEVGNFSEGLAAVRTGEHWGYVDNRGNLVIPLRFTAAEPFSSGEAEVQWISDAPDGTPTAKSRWIDRRGRWVNTTPGDEPSHDAF